ALAAFQQSSLLSQTLARTINGEFRTQDAPFVARALLMSVYGREAAWEFVKTNWETMERQYPKAGLRRLAEGVTGLATPELERDVHAFFQARRPQFGGKTLEQYLEQLRIAVRLRERESAAPAAYLARFAGGEVCDGSSAGQRPWRWPACSAARRSRGASTATAEATKRAIEPRRYARPSSSRSWAPAGASAWRSRLIRT